MNPAAAAAESEPPLSPTLTGVELDIDPAFEQFKELASKGNLIPLFHRVMSDQLTPVMAYNCLIDVDDRDAPSFLLESVVNGERQARYSFVGAQPLLEVVVHQNRVVVLDHSKGTRTVTEEEDPMEVSWV